MTIQQKTDDNKLIKLNLLAPINGESLPLSQHHEPSISHGLRGQGLMIKPLGSRIVAPCDGMITHKAATSHQLIMQVEHGVLIEITCGHSAMQTMGVGFVSKVQVGQLVKTGDSLIELDLLGIKKQITHLDIAMLMSNGVLTTRPQYGSMRSGEDIIMTGVVKLS
jgi:phosphotransferase system IIA component